MCTGLHLAALQVALTLAQALTDDVLCGLGSNTAKLLGLEGRDHALTDLVALADLLGILQADLGVGVLDLLHDVTQQAGTERAELGVNVHNDIVVLDLVVLLDRNDDGCLDLVDQVVLGQAALLFQCRKGLKNSLFAVAMFLVSSQLYFKYTQYSSYNRSLAFPLKGLPP